MEPASGATHLLSYLIGRHFRVAVLGWRRILLRCRLPITLLVLNPFQVPFFVGHATVTTLLVLPLPTTINRCVLLWGEL